MMTLPYCMAHPHPVIEFGHPTLHRAAWPVETITSPAIQHLIDDLIATVLATNGVGIAAPQIDCADRVCIVASRPNPRYPDAPSMPPIAMVNPALINCSEAMVKDWEGCLSLPGLRGLVPRHQAVTVAYWDRQGDRQEQQFTDFVARIVQHELDHLDGKVFLDRIEKTMDLTTEATFLRHLPARVETD